MTVGEVVEQLLQFDQGLMMMVEGDIDVDGSSLFFKVTEVALLRDEGKDSAVGLISVQFEDVDEDDETDEIQFNLN